MKYILAYGSLINVNKIKELNKNKLRKTYSILLKNHIRHWIHAKNNKKYLGIYKKNNNKLNGVLIEVDEEEINKLDKRESYYKRKIINKNDINIKLNEDDIVYAYYPNSLYTKKCIFDYHKKNMKYLYKCIDGINNLSFLNMFLLTTFG